MRKHKYYIVYMVSNTLRECYVNVEYKLNTEQNIQAIHEVIRKDIGCSNRVILNIISLKG